jgi:DNA-binding MarR family transcriptional regulator
MSKPLQQEIRQSAPFESLEEEAFLDLQRTASLLLRAVARELEGHDLTPAQYNTLRILRGAGDGGLACGEVGERLVSPGPDVTRLLDRLEKGGLIARWRDEQDRRVVRARITPEGLALLATLDAPVNETLGRLLGPVGEARLHYLIGILDQVREMVQR